MHPHPEAVMLTMAFTGNYLLHEALLYNVAQCWNSTCGLQHLNSDVHLFSGSLDLYDPPGTPAVVEIAGMAKPQGQSNTVSPGLHHKYREQRQQRPDILLS